MSEDLELVNRRIVDNYGKYLDGQPLFRIVWSDDQISKEICDHTPEGWELLTPEVREVRKYSYIHGRWILEKLLEVPEFYGVSLTSKLSYECIWVFETNKGVFLPYDYEMATIAIDQVQRAMSKTIGVKYKDPDILDSTVPYEKKLEYYNKLQEQMFPNETNTGDALAHNYGVTVPGRSE